MADAEAKSAQAQEALAEVDARIGDEIEEKKDEVATAQRSLQDAQDKLAKELADLQAEIEAEVKKVQPTPWRPVAQGARQPGTLESDEQRADLIAEAKAASTKRKLIFTA